LKLRRVVELLRELEVENEIELVELVSTKNKLEDEFQMSLHLVELRNFGFETRKKKRRRRRRRRSWLETEERQRVEL